MKASVYFRHSQNLDPKSSLGKQKHHDLEIEECTGYLKIALDDKVRCVPMSDIIYWEYREEKQAEKNSGDSKKPRRTRAGKKSPSPQKTDSDSSGPAETPVRPTKSVRRRRKQT